jgi:AraC-like DNA-binding protein
LSDPLGDVVHLLQPSAAFSKMSEGVGAWRVGRSEEGRPFYCALLEGSCRLTVSGQAPLVLEKDDFVLTPSLFDFVASSIADMPADQPDTVPVELGPGHYRFGELDGPPDVKMLVGYCAFGSTDAHLLVSLLPDLVLARGNSRLTALVQFVAQEFHGDRPGREVVMAHLVEVMLIEALRTSTGPAAPPGLLRGLDDERLAVALRQIHDLPAAALNVAGLAKQAGLSRSSFFERFRRAVGVAPMEYLLHWRMALAKDLLRRRQGGVAEIAERVGYSSASTFSVAFARHVGSPPSLYARREAA